MRTKSVGRNDARAATRAKFRAAAGGLLVLLVALLCVAGCTKKAPLAKPFVLRVWTTENAPQTLQVMNAVGDQLMQQNPMVEKVEVRGGPGFLDSSAARLRWTPCA